MYLCATQPVNYGKNFFKRQKSTPGGNPTIVSYNASAVKNYNAVSSLVRFGNKPALL
jgi:hypothetical protein